MTAHAFPALVHIYFCLSLEREPKDLIAFVFVPQGLTLLEAQEAAWNMCGIDGRMPPILFVSFLPPILFVSPTVLGALGSQGPSLTCF